MEDRRLAAVRQPDQQRMVHSSAAAAARAQAAHCIRGLVSGRCCGHEKGRAARRSRWHSRNTRVISTTTSATLAIMTTDSSSSTPTLRDERSTVRRKQRSSAQRGWVTRLLSSAACCAKIADILALHRCLLLRMSDTRLHCQESSTRRGKKRRRRFRQTSNRDMRRPKANIWQTLPRLHKHEPPRQPR